MTDDAHDETEMLVVKNMFTSITAAGGRLIDPQHSVSSESTNKAEPAGTGIPLMLCRSASRTDLQLNASFHGLSSCVCA